VLRLLLARIYYMWGSLHRNFGNQTSFQREHRAAVRCFGRAYQLDPNLRQARLDRGIVLWREMGRVEEALADFDGLLEQDPAYGLALLNRAMVLQEVGRYRPALADLETFLHLADEDEEYRQIAIRTRNLLRDLIEES
jgi:tetratricopeptide (TPR) repeat protein